jgi:hypothetical protein
MIDVHGFQLRRVAHRSEKSSDNPVALCDSGFRLINEINHGRPIMGFCPNSLMKELNVSDVRPPPFDLTREG